MILEKYGVQLKKISIEDIELIRNKRNSEVIASKMVYRDFITENQQLKWFESVNNMNNFYYLIIHNDQPIGLINEKDMNWKNLTSEAGMFIWEESYLKTIIPSLATLILLELGFEILLWNKTKIKIIENNHPAIIYNKQIGFKEVSRKKGVVFMELTRENYLIKTRKLVVAATKSFENSNLVVKIPTDNKELIIKVKEMLSNNKNIVFSNQLKEFFSFSYKIKQKC